MLPEFGESAEDGGLGDLFAELRGEVVGREAGDGLFCALGKQGVGVQGERRDFGGAAGGGRLLPCLVAAEGEDVREGERGDEEVGGFGADAGGIAEEVEGNGSRVEDEAREEGAGLLDLGKSGSWGGDAEGSLDERGSGCGKLCCARGEEDQTAGVEPVAEHVDGENGVGVVAPMGETSGGELIGRGCA